MENKKQRLRREETAELALIAKRLSCEADLKLKLLLVGSSQVGKTSLVSRFAGSQDDMEALKPTVVGDFHHFNVRCDTGWAHVRIWDMGGAEIFHQRNLLQDFYRDVDAILLVFSLTDFESFRQLPVWLQRIADKQSRPLDQIDCYLVGNKSDRSEHRLVSIREAEDFAQRSGLRYLETSALNNQNVEPAFKDLINAAAERKRVSLAASATAATAGGGRRRRRRAATAPMLCLSIRAMCCGCGGARQAAGGGLEARDV